MGMWDILLWIHPLRFLAQTARNSSSNFGTSLHSQGRSCKENYKSQLESSISNRIFEGCIHGLKISKSYFWPKTWSRGHLLIFLSNFSTLLMLNLKSLDFISMSWTNLQSWQCIITITILIYFLTISHCNSLYVSLPIRLTYSVHQLWHWLF